MTTPKGYRVNARLPPESARKMAYLERATSMSTTEVVRESIERFYTAVVDGHGVGPAEAFARSGFIGCARGPSSLSSTYKVEQGRSLEKKT